MYQHIIDQFIQQEALPETYRRDIQEWYLPLVADVERLRQQQAPAAFLLGINGAQGTGKSTLAALLVTLLQARKLRAVHLSLDDFYLGRQQRAQLARDVHPLLATRGVPGTHAVPRLLKTLHDLATADTNAQVLLPGFEKGSDDTLAEAQWRRVRGPIDVIILEGWCVGLQPQADLALAEPVNCLEQTEDSDASWRRFVNAQLGGDYQLVFDQLDALLMLQVPGFKQVLQWRTLQEAKLRRKSVNQADGMNAEQIARFVQHFERLTRHGLQTLPQRADIVFALNTDHQVVSRIDNFGGRQAVME